MGGRPVLHLFTCGSQKSRKLLKAAMRPAKCTCNALRRHFPSPFAAGQEHLVCRTPDQWSTLLPGHLLPVVLQNARNVALPTHDFVERSTQRLHEQFERFSESDDTFPVFPKLIVQDTILQDNARYISKYPRVNPTVVQQCQETLRKLRLSASVPPPQGPLSSVIPLCVQCLERRAYPATSYWRPRCNQDDPSCFIQWL